MLLNDIDAHIAKIKVVIPCVWPIYKRLPYYELHHQTINSKLLRFPLRSQFSLTTLFLILIRIIIVHFITFFYVLQILVYNRIHEQFFI